VAKRVIAAVEIEIGVLADIGDGRLVAGRLVDDREFAIAMHAVGDEDSAIAGVAAAAVGVDDLQDDAVAVMLDDRPVAQRDVLEAAMQVADAVFVEVELIILAVDRELAAADAVGIAAGRRAEIGGMGGVAVEIIEAEGERRVMAFEPEILNDGAPGDHLGGEPAARDFDAMDGLARLRRSKNVPLQSIRHPVSSPVRVRNFAREPALN